MSKLNETFAIVILLSFSQLHDVNAALKYLEQAYFYPHNQVIYNKYALKEGNLVYAVCNETTTEKNCTVIQRQFPGDPVTRSCNITLQIQHPKNVNLTNKVAVHAFGKENAILLWGEMGPRAKFHLTAIRLDSCEIKTLQLDDSDQSLFSQQINAHKILTYDNDFEIFFEPSDLASSTAQVLTRIRVSQEFHSTYDFIKKSGAGTVRVILPIATRSRDRGYVYCITKKRNHNLWLVKPDGTEKLLASHKNELVSTSAGYDVVTSCANPEMDSKTVCTQYDGDGNVRFNVTVILGDRKVIVRQVVHNTRDGFLVMATTLEMFGDEANDHMKSTCEVVRFNCEGKRVGSIRLEGFVERLKKVKTHSIWESKDQYCAASIGQTWPADNLDVAVNCFTKDDFAA